jgi:hypothetical protein
VGELATALARPVIKQLVIFWRTKAMKMLKATCFAVGICMLAVLPASGGESGRPRIVKHGTIDLDLVETTPVVFHGRLLRYEYVRDRYLPNKTGDSYFRFVDVETGEPTPGFAKGFHLGSAFVDGDKMVVTGTDTWGGHQVELFWSADLITWQSKTVLNLPRHKIYNTSICKVDEPNQAVHYVMMFEIGAPPEETGAAFTARFAKSNDLMTWELTPADCVYAKDRYTAPHCLRYLDGYYYNFYLEAHQGYEMRVVRSRDLVEWQASPLNPVLRHSPEDKRIANPKLTAQQRGLIEQAENRNNSDIDFCEFEGRTVITYSWGNQKGVEFLAEASCDGTVESFLRGFFPEAGD